MERRMGPSLKASKSDRSYQRDGEIRVNFQQAPMWRDTSRGLERDRALQEGWKLIGLYQKVGAGTKRFQKVGKLIGLYHRVGAGMRRF